ncbi:MAG: S8 family serine peptidase [Puia sp.]
MNILDSFAIKMNKDTPTFADFQKYKPQNNLEERVKNKAIEIMGDGMDYITWQSKMKDYKNHVLDELDYDLNLDFNPRKIVGDDSSNAFEHFYGNTNVMGPDALHGTHVSGIIAAVRGNGIGIQGIANHVSILMIRTVPAGDERDKDVANAIRYAADHGCKVVNMSFGKSYSPDKKAVDEAVQYAMSKDVLLIQAAGNDGLNIDHEPHYPNRIYMDGTEAGAYLVVGASTSTNDSNLVADFSNYGKKSVDVFAPGVDIYSCVPGSKYQNESGTSMAAPVVTGIAALIREYYPKLTALQVKQIIMLSVVNQHKIFT